MENNLSKLLIELKQFEDENEKLSTLISEKRSEVLEELNSQDLKQYKDELATVSFVERKTVKFNKPKEEVLNWLEDNKIVKYFDIIPEQIIPETKQISKKFEEDLKNGIFTLNGVEVETKESPMIRFNN